MKFIVKVCFLISGVFVLSQTNEDKIFFTSTINNNGIEELKKYILKELSKFEA